MLARLIVCSLLVSALLGCDGREAGVPVEPPGPVELAQAVLRDIASTGTLNSSIEGLQDRLDAVRATDPAKADELLADYEKLMAIPRGNVAKIKATAKEMVDKF
ncbi:hypothetical protein Poly24_48210 [Rosistilla carotiformis]|uniref:Photosystem II protein PsbQ n=1 Tax=Rosistilla carotiformis TaxID=2528017 RepID=A0A518JZW5_9BACT|nr:hypothetical protein [Rosistilla carotiformis]QDV71088.1 hypothetical protein Poly24_48210 [Rosistilla carotiformis]